MRSRLVPAVLLPVLLLSGCSSDDGGSGNTAADGPAATVEPGATLIGTLGEPDDPDAFTIGLTDESGAPVTELPAGSYTIEVEDASEIHNWRITGPGVDEATSVGETESATFEVTLEAGEYTYVCDPHSNMVGEITVV
jgi:hypothetical protein